jgi:hypothetical protein
MVTAIAVMAMMLTIGLAAYASVDEQTRQSGAERQRDSVFNLSEGALQQQGYVLGVNWPGNAGSAYPQSCTPFAYTNGRCPPPATLLGSTGNFDSPDYGSGVTWETRVRDNCVPPSPGQLCSSASDFWDSGVLTAPRWDSNGDGKLWVWACAVKGSSPTCDTNIITSSQRRRTIIALLKRETLSEGLPPAVVRANGFSVSNNAPRTILDGTGTQIVVRCVGLSFADCAKYDAQRNQVAPTGGVVQDPAGANADLTVNPDQLARFKTAAISNGTYLTACPHDESEIVGPIVYIDVPMTTTCSLSGNAQINSETSPGFLLMPKGKLNMSGAVTYYGVIYMGNCRPESCPPHSGVVLDIGGNATVIGGVIVDGPGTVDVGSNGSAGRNTPNIEYRTNAFARISTFGTAGLVQNTWQELSGN